MYVIMTKRKGSTWKTLNIKKLIWQTEVERYFNNYKKKHPNLDIRLEYRGYTGKRIRKYK